MARKTKVKCLHCGKTDLKEIMVKSEYNSRRYLHEDCKKEYEAFRREEEREQREKDSMFKTFAEIYEVQNYQDISTRIYIMFTNLRQGNPVFSGKAFDKRYREGFSYYVIERAILDCRDRIEYANKTKDFQSMSSAMFYGIKIIVDRIPSVNKKVQREMAQREIEERRAKQTSIDEELLESVLEQQQGLEERESKKSDTVDISRFL